MDLLKPWSSAQPGGAGRPFVTYYDVSSGERTELSGTTTGNWVAKVANLLIDECDAEPGVRVNVALPTHWLRPVWLLATWAVGGTVISAGGDIVICGPDGMESAPAVRHRFASALLPFGAPFPNPPAGFLDLGVVLPGQPDAYFATEDAQPDDPAVDLPDQQLTYADLEKAGGSGERLLYPATTLANDITSTVAAARGGGSMVLVSHGSPADTERIAQQEHVRYA
ncbi:MAG: TIGR03089 family protein [Aeromicrobium sp.]